MMAENEEKRASEKDGAAFDPVEPERAPLTEEMVDWLWEHPECRAEIARMMRDEEGSAK